MKKINFLWSCSLLVIGICTMILSGSNIFNISLTDYFVRCIGIIDIIALPILAYTTIIRIKCNKK